MPGNWDVAKLFKYLGFTSVGQADFDGRATRMAGILSLAAVDKPSPSNPSLRNSATPTPN